MNDSVEVGRTSRGATVFVEETEQGPMYTSDEIGGGVLVWHTALASREALELALKHEFLKGSLESAMSGGHFDYRQDRILEMVLGVEEAIAQRGKDFSPATSRALREGVGALKIAYTYAQRIDWLLSGDDGEDAFHRRLQADLAKLSE